MSDPTTVNRFTQLREQNWRNFRRVDVALRGRAFLVGPNASGKSNFLDALRFLHDIASVGGGLQEAVIKRGGVPQRFEALLPGKIAMSRLGCR